MAKFLIPNYVNKYLFKIKARKQTAIYRAILNSLYQVLDI